MAVPAAATYVQVMQTVEKHRVIGRGNGLGDDCKVIVVNDDHNPFQGAAATLSRHLPSVTHPQGFQLAEGIHHAGRAIVWSGPCELAELHWDLLRGDGLTMAPLEYS